MITRCAKCGRVDELRLGYCFDCASEGDRRLGSRSVHQHIRHAIGSALRGTWWMARMDMRCAWERLTRSGEYAPGREWQDL